MAATFFAHSCHRTVTFMEDYPLPTITDYANAPIAARVAIAKFLGWRIHRDPYAPFYDRTRAAHRINGHRTPTHRGEPNA